MNCEILNIVNQYFNVFVDKYGFYPISQKNENSDCSIEYACKTFVISLETYRHEVYAALYRTCDSNNRISLFNLIAFLASPSSNVPEANFFFMELDVEQRYRKQLAHIASTLESYLPEITKYFSAEDYIKKKAEAQKFVMNKYPGLFKRH